MQKIARGERGIGNLAFIAVLVLFIVALALWFVTRDEADKAMAENVKLRQQINEARNGLTLAQEAYDAMKEPWGFPLTALNRNGDKYPEPAVIKSTIRAALMGAAKEIESKSETALSNRIYEITEDAITFQAGDPNKLILYKNPMTADTITAQGMLAPMAGQFAAAAKIIRENNDKFEQEAASNKQYMTTTKAAAKQVEQAFETSKNQLRSQVDTLTNSKKEVEDRLNDTTNRLDEAGSKNSALKTDFEKRERELNRQKDALEGRLINEKEKKKLALAENPKDGEVIASVPSNRICYIDLGRKNKLSNGTRFTVWKAGKGNQRIDVAQILVTRVDGSMAKCSVEKLFNSRLPVSKGHNISNPFYNPKGSVTVLHLRRPDPLPDRRRAYRRLAANGAKVSQDVLDERVDIIVLGAPPVSGNDEDINSDDEGERNAAIRRADAAACEARRRHRRACPFAGCGRGERARPRDLHGLLVETIEMQRTPPVDRPGEFFRGLNRARWILADGASPPRIGRPWRTNRAKMTISEHLEELRTRLLRSFLATLVGFTLAFVYIDEVFAFHQAVPLDRAKDAIGDPEHRRSSSSTHRLERSSLR